ncbi:MAG: FtsH protease activity modulator HflK [Rhodospirillales bacterium]|nr:FtsH protease activity modulator HflK [Rhodospirillales bacterium]MCB9996339.1 FtsH protease activity modulator HflK [Rhodospirillales bacterium]
MGWQDQDNDKKKNPWGSRPRGNGGGGPNGPWGGGPHGEVPPDLEDMLRKAQDNLRQVMPGNMNPGKAFGLALLAVIALWLASGIYIVVPGEHAVEQRFGAWTNTKAEEGMGYHLPWPIETVQKVNVSELRRMEIGFSEMMGRGGAGKRDIPEESLMLTSDANIVDLDMVVLWNIKSAEEFLFQIHDQENTIKKVAESAIREVVGQTRMFPIITQERAEVANRAKEIMAKNLDDYHSGVNISQVLIQEAEVHPDVQDAFQDVQSAKQDAIDAQNRAQAYREDILPKARGEAIKLKQQAQAYKQSVAAKAKGDADRFNAIYEAYKTGEDVTKKRMYLETMEDVLQNAQKIILDGSGQNGGVVPYLPLNELKPAAGNTGKSTTIPQPAANFQQ